MRYEYNTRGTCSSHISFEIEDGIVKNVVFTGGCDGNLKAIPRLVEGMEAAEVVNRLRGVDCHGKGTSCGDQLARAIAKAAEL